MFCRRGAEPLAGGQNVHAPRRQTHGAKSVELPVDGAHGAMPEVRTIPRGKPKGMLFAPLMRDVEAIAEVAQMTEFNHRWHAYLTVRPGELKSQDKTYVVEYAEPVRHGMDGYVYTFQPHDRNAPVPWFVSVMLHRIRGVIEASGGRAVSFCTRGRGT